MDNSKLFKVGVRRKIPFITNFFLEISLLFFVVIILFDILFYPIRSLPEEMKSAIFFFLVPEFWKKVLLFSVFGFCVSTLLFFYLRFYKTALLKFNIEEIIIRGKTIRLTIPIKTITKIYCNDAFNYEGISKEKLSITVEQQRLKATTINLKHYDEADDFMEEFLKYEKLNIKFYNFTSMPTHMEEE